MNLKAIYNEIITEHNKYPNNEGDTDEATLELEGVNPSCGDDYTIQLKVDEAGIITGGSFKGDGCAISKASSDMMLDLVVGKTTDEALRYSTIFQNMIKRKATPEEIEELEEAGALENIANMPARVKCAVLSWHTIEEMINTSHN